MHLIDTLVVIVNFADYKIVCVWTMCSQEFLPSEAARLVLSYLLENNYDSTKEVFMSECEGLAELKSFSPRNLILRSKVNGITLSEILKIYIR